MGYRGEDVPADQGDWGRQQPWQPPSGMTPPGSAGAWDDGPRGYGGTDGYPAADGDAFGYGPPGGQHRDPYGQPPPYDAQGGYRATQEQRGYGTQGSPQQGAHAYERPQLPAPGYDQPSGYDRAYDQRPAPGYGSGGYPAQHSGGYPTQSGGYGRSGGYPARSAENYPAPPGGSGAYPALPPVGPGGYPVEDAGNDWYGGQPAAANGASFADTGTYALNGRIIDEYGTGPRGALRDPVRGYPPGPGRQGSGPLPISGPPALPAPPSVAETRQQARLDGSATRPVRPTTGFPGAVSGGFPKATSGGLPRAATSGFPRAATSGFPATGADDTFTGNGRGDFPGGFDNANADPHQDPYADAFEGRPSRRRRVNREVAGKAAGNSGGAKRLVLASLAVVLVGVIGVAVYKYVLKPGSSSNNQAATGSLPTGGARQSMQPCPNQQTLGTYCHIETAADDPKPLTTTELYLPSFTNDVNHTSYTLAATKLDAKCSTAVIGTALINALHAGKCTQVARASYVSGNGKIMGTIGVINLSTTTLAGKAGRVVGRNDFIAPLTSAKGVASKLGNGTGIVEAELKGHYLILTWSEFVDGTTPTTKAQDNQLKQFSSDIVAGTANTDLDQRMVTGSSAPGASG